MAAAVEKIKISLEFSDSGAAAVVKKLESSFRGLTNAANQLDSQGISKVRDRIKNFDTAGKRNISTIQSQIGALKALRNEAQIGSTQFRQLTADISRYSQELQKAEGRKKSGGRLAGVAKGVGAIAAGGVFGGPEGAIGGGIGLALGGPGGAAVGAAIGAQVGNIRKQAGAVAETVATFNKYQIALAGVSTNQDDFNTSIQAAKQFSEQFVVPLDTTIAQYTKLKASVVGAGLGTDETNKAFEALSASVIATGGSTEDLNSALRAASQVFSKGKVSAEELRQQIGERLPGAFTIFADSMGISTKQLDKLLEQGKVTLDDFVGFTEELIRRYGTTAEELAKAPELAGARLEVAIKKAQLAFGGFFANVGAGFQDYFTNLIDFALENEETLKDVIAQFILFGENVATVFTEIGKGILEIFGPIFEYLAGEIAKFAKSISGDVVRGQRLQQYQQTYGQTSREALQRTAEQRAVARVRAGDSDSLVEARLEELDKLLVSGLGLQAGGIDRLAQIRSSLDLKMPTNFGSGLRDKVLGNQPDGTQGGGTVSKDISKEEADKQIAQLALRERGITLTKEQIQQAAELARKAAEALPPQKQRVELKNIEITAANQINRLEQQQLRKANSVSKAKIELNKLLTKAKGESGMFTDEQLKQAENQIQLNELMLKFNILVEDGVLSAEELEEKLRKALEALNKPGKEGMEKFKEQFKKGLDSMADVAGNLAGAATNAVQGLGDKIHEVVTTGKADFKEFARSVLSDISKIMIQAAIAGAVKKVLGSANGNAFTSSGVVPFAKGGIVSKPTMFQYADGASGSFGLMGEAGAEAIMPLKRGPSGRLGVEVTNQGSARDAMNRYSRRSAGGASGGVASEDEAIAAVQGSSAGIDVRYSVERINNVDYVTADQFQQGLQQAAAQGAQRGEQQTLRRLQMSSSTRRRIGV